MEGGVSPQLLARSSSKGAYVKANAANLSDVANRFGWITCVRQAGARLANLRLSVTGESLCWKISQA